MCISPCCRHFGDTKTHGLKGYGMVTSKQTRCVSHCGLAIYIKTYLTVKEELWKLKHFTMQKYNVQKIL